MFDEGGPPVTARRIMGTEVEYGISVPGQPTANPVITSTAGRAGLRGGRGHPALAPGPLGLRGGVAAARRARASTYPAPTTARPTQLADSTTSALANVILTNGARLYVDHAHPEYSTPEVTNPRDVVLWDKAGERVMAEAARRAATVPGAPDPPLQEQHRQQGRQLRLPRELPDAPARPRSRHRRGPHPVLRHPAGDLRRRPGRASGQDGYERGLPDLASAADYFEVEVGLETTLKRPIINTRDEPHADADKYRRLHVIIGDANLSEISTLPQGRHHRAGPRHDRGEGVRSDELRHRRPGPAGSSAISHDPSLKTPIELTRRPPAHRAGPAVGLLRAGRQATSRTPTAPTSTTDTADVLDAVGHGARRLWPATR